MEGLKIDWRQTMQVRCGFVSNSSSSSFVVAFPHKPESVGDLKETMFGKQEWHYDWISEEDVPTLPIVEKVFAKVAKEATSEEVFESIRGGWFEDGYYNQPGHADYRDDPEYKAIGRDDPNRLEKQQVIWDKYAEVNDGRAKDIAEAFCDVFKGNYIVVMEFSDNAGEEVEEHTNIFSRLEHIRTSYH